MEQLGNNTIYRKSLIFLERRATTRFSFNKLRREKNFYVFGALRWRQAVNLSLGDIN